MFCRNFDGRIHGGIPDLTLRKKFESLTVNSRRCCRVFQQLLHRLRLRHKTSAWTRGGPAGRKRLAGEEKLGRCRAVQSKYYRLYLHSGKWTPTAMYLRRVRVACRTFAAALTHVSAVDTPPATAEQNLSVGIRWPFRGRLRFFKIFTDSYNSDRDAGASPARSHNFQFIMST
jgi:hypothetical protein